MKIVYILALVAACYGSVVNRDAVDLPAPNVEFYISDGALKVSWDGVENDDANNPIVGYKLALWELKPIKATISYYSLANFRGKHTIHVDQIPTINPNRTPKGKYTEILTSATERAATTETLKPGVTYEFRVQAFTRTRLGSMSYPIRVKIDEE